MLATVDDVQLAHRLGEKTKSAVNRHVTDPHNQRVFAEVVDYIALSV